METLYNIFKVKIQYCKDHHEELEVKFYQYYIRQFFFLLLTIVTNTTELMSVSRPSISKLKQLLCKLVHWEGFAIQLPGIEQHHIEQIERDVQDTDDQKHALFAKWLKERPNASWDEVTVALEKEGQNDLAENVWITLLSEVLIYCLLIFLYIYIYYILVTRDSKPNIGELCEQLKNIVHWKEFGCHLPGIEEEHVKTIEEKARHDKLNPTECLLKEWLEVQPRASWRMVVVALVKGRNISEAKKISR